MSLRSCYWNLWDGFGWCLVMLATVHLQLTPVTYVSSELGHICQLLIGLNPHMGIACSNSTFGQNSVLHLSIIWFPSLVAGVACTRNGIWAFPEIGHFLYRSSLTPNPCPQFLLHQSRPELKVCNLLGFYIYLNMSFQVPGHPYIYRMFWLDPSIQTIYF